ncbi:MAG: hypothetical protein A3J93_02775 [Candidatus Magasanikbacteria bacterium RIFOXYC2_FULL_42_28]|uniref:Uncharacterized protein n=1 Tax=Candidatus Magasanikbacteria bacterium RIFOXYC2_FULL_42_28 TaxID=1798704 RepID=A0A1F6NU01_9BACT|nr:MAG: hypothetical protein A3J93_02775 [Candidatus Magasanikbacteria bacterium RIFOXYC2_FULL_42_28]
MSASTLNIFRIFHRDLPALFPADRRAKIQEVLKRLENNPNVSVEEIENALVAFGYEAWPWHKAKRHFWQRAWDKLGEHFFVPKLSASLKEKYGDFVLCGGTLREVHAGASVDYFNIDERRELIDALTQLENDLARHVDTQISGVEKEQFLRLVDEYRLVADKIKVKLVELRMLAQGEKDHVNLVREINEKVKLFEHGWCYLAPEPDYRDVCEAVEFFKGRKKDLNRMRGAHLIPEVNFYL